MSGMAKTYSPGWKLPNKVVKVKKTAAKKSKAQRALNLNSSAITGKVLDSKKRKNPFKQWFGDSDSKLQKTDFSGLFPKSSNSLESPELFNHLDTSTKAAKQDPRTTKCVNVTDIKAPEICSKKERQYSPVLSDPPVETRKLLAPPIDLSLKQRVRVVSEKPTDWCCHLTAAQRASATLGAAARGVDEEDENVSDGMSLESALHYWVFPSLPWLSLFPRISSELKTKQKSKSAALPEPAQQALLAEWTESFSSLFSSVKHGRCPLAYMLSDTLSVVCVSPDAARGRPLTLLLTPTTQGLRQALRTEGIEYSMPLRPAKKRASAGSTSSGHTPSADDTVLDPPFILDMDKEDGEEEQEGEGGDEDENEDAAGWLESMGLDSSQFPALDPNKASRTEQEALDYRPESLVCVQGHECQAVVNFLLNWRRSVSTTGAFAGVPPTLLSPMPFKAGTLRKLSTRSSVIKQGQNQERYMLEVQGPVMPHTLTRLSHLFARHTQAPHFYVSCHLSDSTAPLTPAAKLLAPEADREQYATVRELEFRDGNFLVV